MPGTPAAGLASAFLGSGRRSGCIRRSSGSGLGLAPDGLPFPELEAARPDRVLQLRPRITRLRRRLCSAEFNPLLLTVEEQ